ncbi:MAG: hypothetical protein H8E38_13305 [SAR324 cluster bacterium]|nr:hypothetical protein [SAR324 cluster bacterium]MBL7034732.1 hypothetical protein [SAR324 cluster bacterium]
MTTAGKPAKILVIGGSSLDILTVEGHDYSSPGGAGLYTALAAAKSEADVTLFAPVPSPLPLPLLEFSTHVKWIGPQVSPAELPSFHIIHASGETKYERSYFGAEGAMIPDDLPDDFSEYDLVHVVPLGDTGKQLDFIKTCRKRNAALISAGTGKPLIEQGPELIKDVILATDIFFMNEEEAHAVFPENTGLKFAAGKHVFVTKGKNGASVFLAEYEYQLDPIQVNVLDPTGAGDAFCGATIAGLAHGEHPVKAAMSASVLASEVVKAVGPEKLYIKSKIKTNEIKASVLVNQHQVQQTAKLISGFEAEKPYNFIDITLPPHSHPLTLEYFFVTVLQQFSFWTSKDKHYHLPLISEIGGKELKGAFYLFMAYTLKLAEDPDFFSVERQAELTLNEMRQLFLSADNKDVMPALELHLDAANRYGKSMLELGWTPQSILKKASKSNQPLATLLTMLDHVGGYREDPLRKKSALLAMVLNNRPEKYFVFGKQESLPPIVDYHCMRSNLRMGMLDVRDEILRNKLENRELVSAKEEWEIRLAAYQAVEKLPELSGRSMATVDEYFFFSRKRCPEMSEPDCAACSADSVCAHRKAMFQPVFRTDYY